MLKTVKGIFSSLFGWKFYLAASIIILGVLYSWHEHKVQEHVYNAQQSIILEYQEKSNQVLVDKINTDSALSSDIQRIQHANAEDKKVLEKRYNDLLYSLKSSRLQPITNSDNSSTSLSRSTRIIWESPEGNSPRVISGEIAESLALEARRADELRVELSKCYDQYEAVKDAVNTFGKTKE